VILEIPRGLYRRIETAMERPDSCDLHAGVRPMSMSFRTVTELCLDSELTASRDADKIAEVLVSIRTARLGWNGFTNIDGIDALTSLEDLYLQFNYITKIENLDFHFRLKFLALGNNQIEVVENLSHLAKLELLDLSNNLIDTIDVNELPQSLRNVDFTGNSCTLKPDYKDSLVAGLPVLLTLDDSYVDNTITREDITISTPRKKRGTKGNRATKPSESLMGYAVETINSMYQDANIRGRSSFAKHRQDIALRSSERIQESEELFATRTTANQNKNEHTC